MHLKLKFLQIMSKIADVSILETPTPLASANIGNGDTPPPLAHADVLNGWSLKHFPFFRSGAHRYCETYASNLSELINMVHIVCGK